MLGRSLEFNWLRRFDRSLVVPEIVFVHTPLANGTDECGGFYQQPIDQEFLIGDKFVDAHFGLIVIGIAEPENIAETIAHEWRHHWQLHNGMPFDNVRWQADKPYEHAIREYFLRSKAEMDALLFSRKVAPNDMTLEWLDLCHSRPPLLTAPAGA